MREGKMLTVEQLKKIIERANIAGLSRDTGVSIHNLGRIKAGDNTVPYGDIEKLSKYYEA